MLESIFEANEEALYLMHHGVAHDEDPPGRGSGRYGFGTGDNPFQRDTSLAANVHKLNKVQGLSIGDTAKALGFKSSVDLRQALSMENDRRKAYLLRIVPELEKQGLSRKEISEKTGYSQSTINNYLNEKRTVQTHRTNNVAEVLRKEVDKKHYIDVGPGVEIQVGEKLSTAEKEFNCSSTRLSTAIKQLTDEGYKLHKVRIQQLGNKDQFTTVMVLGDKNSEWKAVANDYSLIKPFQGGIKDDGETTSVFEKPKSIDSSRVYIRYTDDSGHGGAEKDGLVELRRGVDDISLGKSLYSQVRIGVDDKYYMKGMAVYSDDVPKGYDVIYNTNKPYGTPPEKVFKPMQTNADGSINWDNPFGANIMANGQSHMDNGDLRVINKVNDMGKWGEWSKTVSSQILSKQPTPLVKKQLELTYKEKVDEFNEIMNLTNPTVKRKLLDSYAEDADASAVKLKAKAFDRQSNYAILPVPSLPGGEEYYKKNKIDGEAYAPNFEHGELLALFRHPHASITEIPIVRVNNKNKEAIAMMGKAPDAIGFNAHIAEKMSGADFDGDSVVAIPLKSANIKSKPQLEGLKGFNTKDYALKDLKDPDHPEKDPRHITPGNKQMQMGITTNLIADMSFQDGVTAEEMTRAIKHSMVVIDSYKHHLDWKQSEKDNGIQELKDKYQGGGGVSTIISSAKSEDRIPERKLASYEDPVTGKKTYGVNPNTGEVVWKETGRTKSTLKPTKKDPNRRIEEPVLQEVPKMMLTGDARTLMSSMTNPHPTEVAYAEFANRMKALANRARKESLATERIKKDPQAAKDYAPEVARLERALTLAKSNAPRERMAQAAASIEYKAALKANPDLYGDKDKLKKLRGQCITRARARVGAHKERIDISDREWEAIQKHAISETKLMEILNNADEDKVRALATPRSTARPISPAMQASIRAMANRPNGPTQAEIAAQLGISTSTVSSILNG